LAHSLSPSSIKPIIGKTALEFWDCLGGPIGARYPSVNILLLELERCDVIGGDHIAFHADHLANLGDATLTIAHAFYLHDDIQRRDDLRSNSPRRQIYLSHLHHVFDTGQGVAGSVSMHRGDRTIMARVHRLQHVKCFRAAHLAYDDSVRTHAQGIPHQIALCHLPRAFEAGRPSFQTDHVRLLKLQLCRILDGDNAFTVINELAHGVQQRRLAGTGTARDQNIEPRPGGDLQQSSHGRRHRAVFDHSRHIITVAWEFADGDAGTVNRQRRQDDVDPAAVWQAAIHHRTGFVNAPSDSCRNLLRHRCNVIIVAESYRDPFQLTLSLDINVTWPIDHDIVNRFIQQERTQRPVAGHVVRNLVCELKLLAT